MNFFRWRSSPKAVRPARCLPTIRPTIERLEAREVLSATLTVQPGNHAAFQTIQSAVNAASPGDTILIASGTYREAVTVTKPGLTLQAAPLANVVIESPGHGAMNGITVESSGQLAGFTLANVTVRDFAGDGVFLAGVVGFRLLNVTARNNGEYGLFPVLSAQGLIQGSTASGSNDTGIYVGESSDVVVRNSVAYDNVNGIEIENSTNVQATQNIVFGNTVGILEDLLPRIDGIQVETASGNMIDHNLVLANNRKNTAPSDDIAAVEPRGTGIAVVGGDSTKVFANVVAGNAYVGIAVLSGNDLLAFAPPGTSTYPIGVSPDPNHTLVSSNAVAGNGFAPPSQVPPGFPMPADLLWTGTGAGNKWVANLYGTKSPNIPAG